MANYFLLVLVALVPSILANDKELQLLKNLKQGLEELQETKVFPSYLNETLRELELPGFFRRNDRADVDYQKPRLEDSTICSTCYLAVNYLIQAKRLGVSPEALATIVVAGCTLLNIESERVCHGVIELYLPIFTYIVETNDNVDGERFCDIVLQDSGCNSTTFEWTIDIPEGETVERKEPSNPESTFNILQISDFHYDPLYTEGKVKDCGEPLCCQADQTEGDVADGTACGYWSEYINTDPSEALVDESIRKANEFDFDYVYFTGDIISHRVWSTSVANNTRDMKLVFRKMKSTFNGKPVYPILGNHEPTPLNEYAIGNTMDPSLATDWLYRLVVSEFSQWLPKSAKQTIMKGGYYTVSPREGFRIIALNSNVAYVMNWWLVNNDTDPFGQLAWLTQTLKEAEDNNEIVHILSHIPTGKSDMLQVWSREYNKIIERFANTIAAQFNGHTHKDQFQVYYSSKNTTEAISIAINGASVICDKSNPSFKIINVDDTNYDVIDYQEWTFNLTQANLNPQATPDWYQLYSFKESYGVSNLSPSSFSELLPRMAANHNLINDYHHFRYRYSDIAFQNECNDNCKKNYLCEIATSRVGDNTQCNWLKEIYDQNMNK